MSELKCCPFCCGEAKLLYFGTAHIPFYKISCAECGCTQANSIHKEAVINAWNTRTPMANIVEKLEELKNEDVCMETSCTECREKYKNNSKKDCYEPIQKLVLDKAINIVKQEIK